MTRGGYVPVLVVAITVAVCGACAAAEAATSGGSQSASAHLALRAAPDVLSVTVNPSSGAFGQCHGGDSMAPGELGFPNGTCFVSGLAVTNTGLRGRIMITGSPLAPTGGGSSWVLCGATDGTTPACQNAGLPGAEQYRLRADDLSGKTTGAFLSQQAECDTAFSQGTCQATPGQTTTELLTLTGPQSTTNSAAAYSTTVTWTAVAP